MTEIIKSSGDVFKDLEVARPQNDGKAYPERIWITTEEYIWTSFRSFRASDLDHGDEYSAYVRADIVDELVEALDVARRYMKTCLGSSFWDGPNPYPIIDAALAKARGQVDA